MESDKPRFQFSLRTMAIAMTILCIVLGIVTATARMVTYIATQFEQQLSAELQQNAPAISDQLMRQFVREMVKSQPDAAKREDLGAAIVQQSTSQTQAERWSAVVWLGELAMGDDAVVNALVDATCDPDPCVRWSAAESLLMVVQRDRYPLELVACIAAGGEDARAQAAQEILRRYEERSP